MQSIGCNNEYNWAENIKDVETKEDLLNSALLEKKAIENADSVIFLLPLGRGSHIELGMAIANNKKIYFCSNNKEILEKNTVNFYEMDNIEHIYGTDDEIYKILIENLY